MCFSSSDRLDKRAALVATRVRFLVSGPRSGFRSFRRPFGQKDCLKRPVLLPFLPFGAKDSLEHVEVVGDVLRAGHIRDIVQDASVDDVAEHCAHYLPEDGDDPASQPLVSGL